LAKGHYQGSRSCSAQAKTYEMLKTESDGRRSRLQNKAENAAAAKNQDRRSEGSSQKLRPKQLGKQQLLKIIFQRCWSLAAACKTGGKFLRVYGDNTVAIVFINT
jgi:hypothetical protein